MPNMLTSTVGSLKLSCPTKVSRLRSLEIFDKKSGNQGIHRPNSNPSFGTFQDCQYCPRNKFAEQRMFFVCSTDKGAMEVCHRSTVLTTL